MNKKRSWSEPLLTGWELNLREMIFLSWEPGVIIQDVTVFSHFVA